MKSSEIAALTPAQRESLKIRDSLKRMSEPEIVAFWYKSETPFELKPIEDKIRQRWDWAKAQFLGLSTYMETVESLMKEFGISIAQARNDIRNMRNAFGNLDDVPKAVHRERAIQMALKTYKLAEKQEDPDGMAKATKVYILASGVDKDDVDHVDLEKLMKERVYVEALDPIIRNYLLNFLQNSNGIVDSSQLFEAVFSAKGSEFIDYETVNKAEDEHT
jgi:hypothetical protein